MYEMETPEDSLRVKRREFDNGIIDLKKVFGDSTFKGYRQDMLWESCKKHHIDWFKQAVKFFMNSSRSAPLPKDFDEFFEQKKSEETAQKYLNPTGDRDAYGILEGAAVQTKADADYVKACMTHLKSFLDRKITRQQFDEGCDYLDEVALKFKFAVRVGA